MLKSVEKRGRKITLKDIKEFETFLNESLPEDYIAFLSKFNGGKKIKLPESYVAFLLKYNGGYNFYPCCYPIEGTKGTNIGEYGGIHEMYGISPYKNEYNDLKEYRQIYKERIPDNLLLIGHDDGNNKICLSLYGEDAGWIWYLDIEDCLIIPSEGEDAGYLVWNYEREKQFLNYRECYKIAESFQEFIDGLFDWDFEKDCRVQVE